MDAGSDEAWSRAVCFGFPCDAHDFELEHAFYRDAVRSKLTGWKHVRVAAMDGQLEEAAEAAARGDNPENITSTL